MLPKELSDKFTANDAAPSFDTVVSYGSIEHNGLTRYGDAPHPWGDLVTMAKGWCLVKERGWAVIGIQTYKTDRIYYNAQR